MHLVLLKRIALAVCGVLGATQAAAQGALGGGVPALVYRCGNEYLNDAALAQSRGCKAVEGGYTTVVPGTRVYRQEPRPPVQPNPAASASPTSAAAPAASAKPGAAAMPGVTAQWSSRDNDARAILQDELKTAQERLVEQQRLFNNGEPEKLGPETRNHQLYLDRVNALRLGIARYTSDIASLQREMARLPVP